MDESSTAGQEIELFDQELDLAHIMLRRAVAATDQRTAATSIELAGKIYDSLEARLAKLPASVNQMQRLREKLELLRLGLRDRSISPDERGYG